ncbi:MAG: hypothetical protein RL616_2156, partial [Verrucomicrobiota bacterium]
MILTKPRFNFAGSLLCGKGVLFSFAAKLCWLGLMVCVLL